MELDDLRADLQRVANKHKLSDFLLIFCTDPQADPITITNNQEATSKAAELFRRIRRWIILNVKQ